MDNLQIEMLYRDAIHSLIQISKEADRMSEKLKLYSKATKSSLENAEQWIKDAKLLMKHGSFGHASALIRFAVEETVKAYVCWFTSEKIWPLENKAVNDVFQSHRAKNEFFVSFILGWIARVRFHSWNKLRESMPELSEEQISEAFEEFKKMITSTKTMRERAVYVNLKGKEIETPLDIEKEEPKNTLLLAEAFIKIVRNMTEKMPEDEKEKLRGFFSRIPEEDWRTGELTIDWLSEVMRETS